MGESVKKWDQAHEMRALVEKVSSIVSRISGNVLGEKQLPMLETRMQRRILDLGLHSSQEYLNYLESNLEEESKVLVSLITTHHTFFFREFIHFEYLRDQLKNICQQVRDRGESCITVWSAACSRGHEAYSLSMFFSKYLPEIDPQMNFKIVASDIDPESVGVAKNGVYPKSEVDKIPMIFLGNHWARGTGDISHFVKAKKSIREPIDFKVSNLMDFSPEIPIHQKFDLILCRNCFIYFDQNSITSIVRKMLKQLHPHGALITGVSESLGGYDLEIKSVATSIYKSKKDFEFESKSTPVSAPLEAARPQALTMPNPLRVLCVDDSKSIHTLLKKILSNEEGFEIVGHAMNGLEAQTLVKELKPDLVTLDLHMPEMDGVSYLKKNFTSSHPPVVVVSSASREDSSFAMESLRSGASDFVEKPALNNLVDRADEIRSKLKMAFLEKNRPTPSSLDQQFAKELVCQKPEDKLRIIVMSYSSKKKVVETLKSFDGHQPSTLVLFEGQDNILGAFSEELKKELGRDVVLLDKCPESLSVDKLYVGDAKKIFKDFASTFSSSKKASILVYGQCSQKLEELILEWGECQLLLEDLGEHKSSLEAVATDIFPYTSFAYISHKYFSDLG